MPRRLELGDQSCSEAGPGGMCLLMVPSGLGAPLCLASLTRVGSLPQPPSLPEQGPALPALSSPPPWCHCARPSSWPGAGSQQRCVSRRRVPLFATASHTTAWRTARPLPGAWRLRAHCQEPGPLSVRGGGPPRTAHRPPWEGLPPALQLPAAVAPCSPRPRARCLVPSSSRRGQPGAHSALGQRPHCSLLVVAGVYLPPLALLLPGCRLGALVQGLLRLLGYPRLVHVPWGRGRR